LSSPGSGPSPIAEIAADSRISESCLRNWLHQADIDEGRKERLSTYDEPSSRRCAVRTGLLKMEKEILGKAAAFFATESNYRPK
jgi:transposase-like protein